LLGHREVFTGRDVEVQYLDFSSRIFGIFRRFSQRHWYVDQKRGKRISGRTYVKEQVNIS
jgi:hypothetical protein